MQSLTTSSGRLVVTGTRNGRATSASTGSSDRKKDAAGITPAASFFVVAASRHPFSQLR